MLILLNFLGQHKTFNLGYGTSPGNFEFLRNDFFFFPWKNNRVAAISIVTGSTVSCQKSSFWGHYFQVSVPRIWSWINTGFANSHWQSNWTSTRIIAQGSFFFFFFGFPVKIYQSGLISLWSCPVMAYGL